MTCLERFPSGVREVAAEGHQRKPARPAADGNGDAVRAHAMFECVGEKCGHLPRPIPIRTPVERRRCLEPIDRNRINLMVTTREVAKLPDLRKCHQSGQKREVVASVCLEPQAGYMLESEHGRNIMQEPGEVLWTLAEDRFGQRQRSRIESA